MGSSSSGPATMGRLRDPELIPYAAVLLLTLLVVTTYNASVGHAPAGPAAAVGGASSDGVGPEGTGPPEAPLQCRAAPARLAVPEACANTLPVTCKLHASYNPMNRLIKN